ncbi:MAG: pilus assembly protein [Planctomycetaceae bacterium]|nr:pilus assembly protein [Planctomycetaceae bacterium]
MPHRRRSVPLAERYVSRSSGDLRRGVVVLEFILAMPVFFILTLAIFEFTFVMLTLQVGHTALIEGTRRAAEVFPPNLPLDDPGADDDIVDQVVEVMNAYLIVQGLEIYDTTQGATDDLTLANARIIVERADDLPVTRGDSVTFPGGYTCTASGPDPTINEVRVTLCYPLVDSSDPSGCPRPVGDWLSTFGFSIADYVFETSSRMLLE